MDVDVVSPAPRAAWQAALLEDPDVLPTQHPAWVDALCSTGRFTDASRLYRTPAGRRLVLPAARRAPGGPVGSVASMPTHWGFGGLIAEGGVRPADVRLVLADLAAQRVVRQSIRPNPRPRPPLCRAGAARQR